MKRLFILMLAVAMTVTGCKVGKQTPAQTETQEEEVEQPATETEVTPVADSTETSTTELEEMNYEPKFKISTTKGDIVIKLYEETPLHKENFIKLANSGFYDGICFHRVINGFMIQVGDPFTRDSTQTSRWGEGGPGYTIPAEIIPGFSHKKGAIAAARRGDSVNPAKESSGSQFYIVQDENGCRHLDGEYTIFGEVVSGFDVIDRIASVATDFRDKPVDRIDIITVTPEK